MLGMAGAYQSAQEQVAHPQEAGSILKVVLKVGSAGEA